MTAPLLKFEIVDPDAPAEGAVARTPLLIAHGLFGQRRNWMSLARRFAERRPVALVDMRNHGESPWVEHMDYISMGRDLIVAAQAAFGRPAILLGHSMGGKSAMAAALSDPSEVAGVIVIDIAPRAYSGAGAGDDHGAYVRAMRAAPLGAETRRRDVEAFLASVVKAPALRAFLVQNLNLPGGGAAPTWRPNLAVIEKSLDDLIGWPEALDAKRYNGPAYFLAGGASNYVDQSGIDKINRLFTTAVVEELPGAGHWLHAEQPSRVFELLDAALCRCFD